MKFAKITLLMTTFLLAEISDAQSVMNLRQCMEYALEHSTAKIKQQADYDDALLQRRDAILQAFTPSVSAGTNAYTNFGRTIDPETNSYISTTSFSNGYSVQAGMTLFDGLSAINKIKIARTAVKMGLSRKQQLDDEICLSVMQAYFKVIYQSEMVKVMGAQIVTTKQNLLLLQKQYELGQKGYADVAQVEADLADREYQQIQMENLKNEALMDLKAIMLWSASDTLNLDFQSVIQPRSLQSFDIEEHQGELISLAQNILPSVRLAKGRMESAKLALRSARGQFLPTLSLYGGWSTSYYTYPGKDDYKAPSFSSQFHNNGGEYVQLSLSFPIYDRLSRHSSLQRKKNDYRRATAEYQQTLKDVENEVARTLQDCKGAHSALFQAEKRMKAQEQSYRLNEKKFAQGLISPVEYQTVSNAYINAKAEQLNAQLQYQLKQSVVSFYNGISYLEQQK